LPDCKIAAIVRFALVWGRVRTNCVFGPIRFKFVAAPKALRAGVWPVESERALWHTSGAKLA